MKQAGKRLISILLIILLLTSAGCRGTESSFYSAINGYAVSRLSNLDVRLIYNRNWEDEPNEVWGGNFVIFDYYVKSFCYNEKYIAVSGIYAQDYEEVTEEELRTSPVIYYLINTLTHEKFGPFDSKDEFDIMCESLETGTFCDWIIVDPNQPLW